MEVANAVERGQCSHTVRDVELCVCRRIKRHLNLNCAVRNRISNSFSEGPDSLDKATFELTRTLCCILPLSVIELRPYLCQ
jgi:hypothetical protein